MNNYPIFTFWEPKDKLTPYLKLCRRTWEINIPEFDIITLDYSNIHHYIDKDFYDISFIKKLTLPMQKDAIMVAVLYKHGGLFLDIDTLILNDISPLMDKLQNSEVIMFNRHMAFIASKAGSQVVSLWLKGIQSKLSDLQNMDKKVELNWDFIGNSVLTNVMDEMINVMPIEQVFQNNFINLSFKSFRRIFQGSHVFTPSSKNAINKFKKTLNRKRRALFFRIVYKKNLTMLDRNKYGFIMEASYYKSKAMTAEEKYRKFWFEENLDSSIVFSKNPVIIGLHNSWTPEWYKELSKKDVLENDCLLSETLNRILIGSHNK